MTRRVERKGFRSRTWRYGWDVLDQLVSCETPEGDTWFYRYDAFGRRLTKVRKLREAELAWAAQKFGRLVPEIGPGGDEDLDLAGAAARLPS